MAWLEAVAAFSVVMMVFSTLATITLETLHRIFGVRAKGLRRLSKVMYKDVLKPHLGAKLKTDSSRQFLTAITQMNGAQLTSDAARTHKASSSVTSFLVDGNKLSSLSTLGFIERLARTTEGRTLFLEGQRRGEAYLNSVIQDIAGNYEALGDNARQYFQRRSRLFSCLI
ncbi:MAG: hypothetical protein O7G86_11770, partial [Gammaproteobacteria bacterium]|nr:hypothetical protein [Gammaproteobacteria bacterium]